MKELNEFKDELIKRNYEYMYFPYDKKFIVGMNRKYVEIYNEMILEKPIKFVMKIIEQRMKME
jgi:hypothetical protein